MNELFRFVAIRPPQKSLPIFTLNLVFETTSPFIVSLLRAKAGDNPREEMLRIARDFKSGDDFISNPKEIEFFNSLVRFEDRVSGEEQIGLEALDQNILDIFGQDAQSIRTNQDFQNHKRALSNSIIAIKIAPVGDALLLAELSRHLRLTDLIERIANRQTDLEIPGAVDSVLSESIIVPSGLFPLPHEKEVLVEPEEDLAVQARLQEIEELQAKAANLHLAIRQLLTISPNSLRQTPQSSDVEPVLPRSSQRSQSFLNRLFLRVLPPSNPVPRRNLSIRPDTSYESLLIRPEAIEDFATITQFLLQELGVGLTNTPVPEILNRVEAELKIVQNRLSIIKPFPTSRSVIRVGSTFVPVRSTLPTSNLGFASSEGSGVPETVGLVRPVGVGSLLLVRQQIKQYEPGEIAHIENVLAGENKDRGTRRLRRTEETFTLLTETFTEEERDLQTTERFELQQEVSRTVQQDESFNVGVSVSAGYGPYFQVNSNFGFSSATSTTDTAKKAFTYAKDVTERSALRISERIRREETVRTIEEFEETNGHGLDNANSDDHIIGIYQWVDKVYEVQIFDYGLRLFFDFIVPEPAVFLFRALESNDSETEGLVAPEPFTELPENIDETNYGELVQKYKVQGVEPIPPSTITVSRAYDASSETFGANFTKSDRIEIPEGYVAQFAFTVVEFTFWESYEGEDLEEGTQSLGLLIGRKFWERVKGDPEEHLYILSGEAGEVPVSLMGFFVASYAVNIEILCFRTDNLYRKWQLDTHEAVMQAHAKLQSDYEEKLAAAAAQQGIEIEGRNPLENRLIERSELKKESISLMTAQHFDLFSSILESPGMLPRIDFDEADTEGHYIRFFEQAFEWENMTYVFYPYFWGRKSKWLERILLRDIDPVHAEFLKAGAARVVVPVRPGFEDAITHFLETGNIWEGGDLPTIGDPLYVDILDEIKERLKAPGDEIPVPDPWEIRLPTTLVRLRPDSSLPRWEKDEEGNWRPVESEIS